MIFTRSKVQKSSEKNESVEGVGKEVEKDEENDEIKIKETKKIILEGKKYKKIRRKGKRKD